MCIFSLGNLLSLPRSTISDSTFKVSTNLSKDTTLLPLVPKANLEISYNSLIRLNIA